MPTELPLPPAGWYPDPSGGHRRRYWDGSAWTDHVAEPGSAPIAAATAPATPPAVADRKELLDGGRRAKAAVLVAVPLYAVTPALQAAQIRESRRAIADLRTQLRELESGRQPLDGSTQVRPYTPATANVFTSAASLPTLVVAVLFLIWFHRAVTVARRLGRPSRRTPGWAVGGWFVPIGNFFLPYQSARDVFRAGDPGRDVVRRWWAAYLVAIVANIPLGVLAGFNDGVEVTIAACAIAGVLWLLAALKTRELIDAANESLVAELPPS